ncbi:MAG: hypothetical protein GDA56_27345 [Hormoscilla sp. GM7CHS1pb]|nr:hypothetical protein [Hormoscilla sp. GM7CHS1pb]
MSQQRYLVRAIGGIIKKRRSHSTQLPTDIWEIASWEEYIELINDRAYEQASGYYYKGRMPIASMPTGYDRSCDKGIPLNGRL